MTKSHQDISLNDSKVRAKFYVQMAQPGQRGSRTTFGAVYEGSEVLQKLSENAIFGNATPNGSAELYGVAGIAFVPGDEWYFDFYPVPGFGETEHLQAARYGRHIHAGVIYSIPVTKLYQGEPIKQYDDTYTVDFRFVSVTGAEINLNFGMTIRNPNATHILSLADNYVVTVHQIRTTPASAEELAERERLLQEMRLSSYGKEHPEWLAKQIASLEAKLAKAKGA